MFVFPCCWQSVSRAIPPTNPRHDALPDVGAVCCLRNAHACAEGGSYSQALVGTTNFAPGRSPSTTRSSLCSRAAQDRLPGFTTSAPTRLTVLRAHHLVLICKQQPYSRASRHKLQRLRRAAPSCVLSALLVSLAVLSVHAHAARCREHPCSGSSDRCSGTDFAEYFRAPQSKSVDKRHCFVILMMSAKYPVQGFNFQCADLEIFTPTVPGTAMKRKG